MDSPAATRRRVLRALGVGLCAGLAGCGGGGETDARGAADPPGSPELDAAGAWPARRYDATNAGVAEGDGLADVETYWILDAGGAPVVADGALYNWDRGESGAPALTRRDPATAAVEARVSVAADGVNGPPTAASEGVYATTAEQATRLDVAGDAVRWRGPAMAPVAAPPTVADGLVYVRTGGGEDADAHLRALDAETGETRWQYGTTGSSGAPVAVADGTLYVVDGTGLHALDATSAESRWHRALNGEWATPVVADGTVYVADDEAGVVAFDAHSGARRWRALDEVGVAGPPVVADDAVHVGGDRLVSLDPADGRVSTEFAATGTPVGRRGGTLYAVDGATLRAFDVTDGSQRWWYGTGPATTGNGVVRGIAGVTPVDGAVYVAAADGLHGVGPTRS